MWLQNALNEEFWTIGDNDLPHPFMKSDTIYAGNVNYLKYNDNPSRKRLPLIISFVSESTAIGKIGLDIAKSQGCNDINELLYTLHTAYVNGAFKDINGNPTHAKPDQLS